MRGQGAWYAVAGLATAYALTSLLVPELQPRTGLESPAPTPAQEVWKTYTNAFLFVRIRDNPDGTRDVQFENFYAKSELKHLSFSTNDAGEILRHGNIEIDLGFGPDVVILRLGDRRHHLYRLERGRAQVAWDEHCRRAAESLEAFQEGFDAWELQEPEFMWWGIAAVVPPKKRASPLFSVVQQRLVGPGLPCPALKEAWTTQTWGEVGPRASCLLSTNCGFYGRCSEVGGKCVATADSCRRSIVCRKSGACRLEAGDCVVGANDCRASMDCGTSGRCVQDSGRGRCVAGSELDCVASIRCATEDECFHDGEACVAQGALERSR